MCVCEGGRVSESYDSVGIGNCLYYQCSPLHTVLLQNGADPSIRNSDGKSPIDLAHSTAKQVLLGNYKKDELLEAARTGSEETLLSLITPLNVNCHAEDGRKVGGVPLCSSDSCLEYCMI